MRRKTTIQFIKDAKKIHGDKYDYSLVEYKNNTIKVKIICPVHGVFEQKPVCHLKGNGCPICGGSLKHTNESFIAKAREVHGDKYDYSKVNYVNTYTKVKIGCSVHGYFLQAPTNHLSGRICPMCAREHAATVLSLNKSEFIKRANKIHNNYYSYKKTQYKSSNLKVIITCPKHGDFEQLPASHLKGHGCFKCKGSSKKTKDIFIAEAQKVHGSKYLYNKVCYTNNKNPVIITCPKHGDFRQIPTDHLSGKGCSFCGKDNLRKTTSQFITKALEMHGNKYDYSKVKYINSNTKVEIICPKHGSFWQRVDTHLAGSGCPCCSESKGEKEIHTYLKNNNIPFTPQYKFDNCKNKRPLPFDFAIFNEDGSLRCLIEYQGKQHFEPNEFFGGKKGFEYILKTDTIKVDYCKNNKILLYHINYFDNLEEKLNQILKHF